MYRVEVLALVGIQSVTPRKSVISKNLSHQATAIKVSAGRADAERLQESCNFRL